MTEENTHTHKTPTALGVDVLRCDVDFKGGHAGCRAYREIDRGGRGECIGCKSVKWGWRWWIEQEMTGEGEEWSDKVSCSRAIMAVMPRWEISGLLSFSIDSVLFYSSRGGALYCFHSSSRGRHLNPLLSFFSPFPFHLSFYLSVTPSLSRSQRRGSVASVSVASHWYL